MDIEAREQRILDAAEKVITQFGYDKTSMSDIAEQANVTRAILYLHFDRKEQLFEALLFRETQRYLTAWLSAMETNPQGGTLAGLFRSALFAVHQSPFLSAFLRKDRRIFGQYLNKPGQIFEGVQSPNLWFETLRALQQVNAVRQDIDLAATAYLMNALAIGFVTMEASQDVAAPPIEQLLEVTAQWTDQLLTPEDGGDQQAGKALLLQMAAAAKTQFEQTQKSPQPNKDRQEP